MDKKVGEEHMDMNTLIKQYNDIQTEIESKQRLLYCIENTLGNLYEQNRMSLSKENVTLNFIELLENFTMDYFCDDERRLYKYFNTLLQSENKLMASAPTSLRLTHETMNKTILPEISKQTHITEAEFCFYETEQYITLNSHEGIRAVKGKLENHYGYPINQFYWKILFGIIYSPHTVAHTWIELIVPYPKNVVCAPDFKRIECKFYENTFNQTLEHPNLIIQSYDMEYIFKNIQDYYNRYNPIQLL